MIVGTRSSLINCSPPEWFPIFARVVYFSAWRCWRAVRARRALWPLSQPTFLDCPAQIIFVQHAMLLGTQRAGCHGWYGGRGHHGLWTDFMPLPTIVHHCSMPTTIQSGRGFTRCQLPRIGTHSTSRSRSIGPTSVRTALWCKCA